MAVSRVERIGDFKCVEGNGRHHTVVIYQNIGAPATLSGDGGGEMRGLKSLKTMEGYRVNFKGPGKFEILNPREGLIPVTTTDPHAPTA